MTLSEDLQAIDGIGPKTAEKIIAVVESHDTDGCATCERALLFLDRGKPHIAQDVLETAVE